MTDLFDLSDVSDLPTNLRQELVCQRGKGSSELLLALFHIAGRELTVDEVQAAYYRKYNEAMDRRKLLNKLYNLHRAGKLGRPKRGVFKLGT